MALRRPVLLILVSSLTVLLLCLGLLAWLRLRTGPRVERLTREAHLLEEEVFTRPSHVSPALPGTLADALRPLSNDISRASHGLAWLDSERVDPCLSVIAGQTPVTSMPPECAEVLQEGRDLMRRVLHATRAEQGGIPRALRHPVTGYYLLFSPLDALPSTLPTPGHLRNLARVAALEMRLLLDQRHFGEAVDLCLDTVALSRELALGGGVHERLQSAQVLEMAYPPCAAALAAAPVERQKQAAEQLTRLSQGWPSLAETVHTESVAFQLYTYGNLFTQEQLARLPPHARDLATDRQFRWEGVSSQVMAREMWRLSSEWFEAVEVAASQPALVLPKALSDVDASFRQERGLAPPHMGPYITLVQETSRQRLQLEALRDLVKAP